MSSKALILFEEAMDLEDEADKDKDDNPAPAPAATNNNVPHGKTSQGKLARLCFVVGHTAVKQLVYMEEVLRDMKKAEERKGKKKPTKAKPAKPKKIAAKKSGRGRKSETEGSGEEDEDDGLEAIEKELGVTVAEGAEDEVRRKKVRIKSLIYLSFDIKNSFNLVSCYRLNKVLSNQISWDCLRQSLLRFVSMTTKITTTPS